MSKRESKTVEVNKEMTRQVINVGGPNGSLAITLDSNIAKLFNIQKGDMIEVLIKKNVVSWFGTHNPFEEKFGKQLAID